jgi:flagellar protein FlaF
MSGRATEARVLTQAALKLVSCQKNWDSADRNELLDTALKYNQRIWSILQIEVSKADNPLPKEIKVNILRLSRFIDNRIFDTMAFPSPEKLDIIIKINKNIAAGLRGSPSGPID